MSNPNGRRWLLIDADDTLWENAVYFEEAFEEFVDVLDHSELSPAEVREILDAIEAERVREHGYGSKSFGRNLGACFERLVERDYHQDEVKEVIAIADQILERPIEVLDGVSETLTYLSRRHHLTLFTKGHSEEQLLKFQRSELGDLFHGVRVVPEKDPGAYLEIVRSERMDPDQTWMIGNSPKSDIHPALEAGLNAVLVPHEATWSLELIDLPPVSHRFQIVKSFADLRRLF